MLPQTPRGFSDVLPAEAAWRESLRDEVSALHKSWGYMPIETPTLEISDVIGKGGSSQLPQISLFNSAGQRLCLRPDVTLPIARMVASRLGKDSGPFRFRYSSQVFRESENLQAQSCELCQIGTELIGLGGIMADVEVISLFKESLSACNLEDFTIAIGSVDALYALLANSEADEAWCEKVLSAYHSTNYVELDRLCSSNEVPERIAYAISCLPRIRGKGEAISECSSLIEEALGFDPLQDLETTWKILEASGDTAHLSVDFSILASFDYYTGLVMSAFAPGCGLEIGSGGRYDHMLESFGRDEPAAGFAFFLERVMQALVAQGQKVRRRVPDALVGGHPADKVFAKASELRKEGLRVCITDEGDVSQAAERCGIGKAFVVGPDGSAMEVDLSGIGTKSASLADFLQSGGLR